VELVNLNSIIHLDADSFFASCEQATHPEYKGKPVITGKERGIVAAASYEAKALGIDRGVQLRDVLKICPDAIIVPSDYETYSLFSKRIFSIMRRFTPQVEEYSIDEAFADLGGLRRSAKMSYSEIALKIKETVEKELNLTVSVGLSVNKVLAKVGSNWNKPSGFTDISLFNAQSFLDKLPTKKIWGIGSQTASFLAKQGILKAGQFAQKNESWVINNLTKPHLDIWKELNGQTIYKVETVEKDDYKSISKFKTFTPPRNDRSFVFSQLSKNVENAFIKARRHKLVSGKIVISLRNKDFRHTAIEGKFNRPTAFPSEAIKIVAQMFKAVYRPNTFYRATGVILTDLKDDSSFQLNLFEDPLKLKQTSRLHETIDELALKYGKHKIPIPSTKMVFKQRRDVFVGEIKKIRIRKDACDEGCRDCRRCKNRHWKFQWSFGNL